MLLSLLFCCIFYIVAKDALDLVGLIRDVDKDAASAFATVFHLFLHDKII